MILHTRCLRLRQKRGAAILLVLAAVTLVSALVINLLEMGSNAQKSSRIEQQSRDVTALADTVVNLAAGHLRAATEEEFPEKMAKPWTSQPGAITIYRMDGSTEKIYKLYSDEEMLVKTTSDVATDLKARWASTPGQYVDLNEPMVIQPHPQMPAQLSFPILDPRLYSKNPAESVEGFHYKKSGAPEGTLGPESGSEAMRLPMPVKWLYQLRDGSLGTLDDGGSFRAMGGSSPTVENPIIGRFAFWTDDESCKVNMNTASEGAFWDTPRADTEQERELAKKQPTAGEYNRQPGHPATVCLSSVLLPNRRYHPAGFTPKIEEDTPTSSLPPEEMLQNDYLALLQLGRLHVGNDPDQSSRGGRSNPTIRLGQKLRDGSFTSAPYPIESELFYSRVPGQLGDAKSGRRTATFFEIYPKARQQLARASFFLTTASSSPELTLFGTPRIALWPIHASLDLEKGLDPEAPVQRTTDYDMKMALLSQLGTRKYAMQRLFPSDGEREMSLTRGGANREIFEHLRKLTDRGTPGFFSPKAQLTTFADKYGQDRDTILLSMLDYVRTANFSDGNLPAESQFSTPCPGNPHEGFGQVSPLQVAAASGAVSQGFGRIVTVSEVAFLLICRAEVRPDGTVMGEPSPQNKNRLKAPGAREFDVALLVEGFVPSQGWADYNPYVSMTIAASSGDPAAPLFKLNGQPLISLATKPQAQSSATPPAEWIAWGGALGVRNLTEKMFQFRPIIINETDLKLEATSPLELKIYDDPSSATGDVATDLVQTISLGIPDIGISQPSRLSLPTLPSGIEFSLTKRVLAAKAGGPLLHSADVVQSMVLAHGDYRVGRKKNASAKANEQNPAFVAHPLWGKAAQAHALREPSLASRKKVLGLAETAPDPDNPENQGYFSDLKMAPGFTPDFPARFYDETQSTTALVQGKSTSVAAAELPDWTRTDRGKKRGPARPDITGDFDNGIGNAPDGPYTNRPDDGNLQSRAQGIPYFPSGKTATSVPPVSVDVFSAHRQIPSAVMFGSLSTGAVSGVPWQTLLFRPQQGHYGATSPPDHLLLDHFWQPVVEPEPISLGWETQGKVNLNHRIAPFSHITRRTALHAALKAETLLAIPDAAAATYKNGQAQHLKFRRYINPSATLDLWDAATRDRDRGFLAASEICALPLVPEGIKEAPTKAGMEEFWQKHRLTGDNSKERPYAHIYPKLTTKSNAYRVHFRAESIQVNTSASPGKFSTQTHQITASTRGSCLVQRRLNDRHPDIPDYMAPAEANQPPPTPLYHFYRWSITDRRDVR